MNLFEKYFYQVVFGLREDMWLEQKRKLKRTPLSRSYPIPEARHETYEEWLACHSEGKFSPTARFSSGVHPSVDGIPDDVAKKLIAFDRFYYFLNQRYWLMRSEPLKK